MINNPSALILSTRYNLQKIYAEGTTVINVLTTLFPFIPPYEYTLFVHNLGYIPTARVFYIPTNNQLWPLSPNQFSNANGGPGDALIINGDSFLTTSELKVKLINSGPPTDVTFYYRIYVDE